MTINDPIYGKYQINEPVLIELINSKPLQRLKKIAQLGVPDPFYHIKGFSRFKHSIGVMLLLRKLNASLEEQVAGLLHDASHLAFSHIYDWVMFSNHKKEDHQDKIHQKFLSQTEIPLILKKYGFKTERVLNPGNFKLLEREIPDLCADRIDYALQEFIRWTNPEFVKRVVKDLINFKERIVFADQKSAFIFANNFLKLQKEHWGGYEAVARYHLFSLILKEALKNKILDKEDFYKDDNFVMGKLVKSGDEKILRTLRFLKNKKLPRDVKGKKETVTKKFRYVDPELMINDQIKKISQVSKRFKVFLEKQKLLNQKGVEVSFSF